MRNCITGWLVLRIFLSQWSTSPIFCNLCVFGAPRESKHIQRSYPFCNWIFSVTAEGWLAMDTERLPALLVLCPRRPQMGLRKDGCLQLSVKCILQQMFLHKKSWRHYADPSKLHRQSWSVWPPRLQWCGSYTRIFSSFLAAAYDGQSAAWCCPQSTAWHGQNGQWRLVTTSSIKVVVRFGGW